MTNKEKDRQSRLELEKLEYQVERDEQHRQAVSLESCLSEADRTYRKWWNSSCESRGLGENCSLPKHQAEVIDKTHGSDKDRCIQLYK